VSKLPTLFLAFASLAAGYSGAQSLPTPPTQYPSGQLGDLVKLGEDIVMNTDKNPLTKDLVGNKLTCASCHIDGGKQPTIGTFIGSATVYPAYSSREDAVLTLQDRNDNCFMRSMNGTRPLVDGKASIAMAAYVSWLSEGIPMRMDPVKPVTPFFSEKWPDKAVRPLVKKSSHADYVQGEALYKDQCAACHGDDGLGSDAAPPLWGEGSYNSGAGMAVPGQLATWVEQNMPPGNAGLKPSQAVDVSLYIDAQPRPAFDLKAHLLPASEMGVYNAKVLDEKDSVRSVYKSIGLDVDAIRGDKAIP